jgi:membrane-associated protease RseP (regulator of RpoE activity)
LPLACVIQLAFGQAEPEARRAPEERGYLGVLITELCPEVRAQTPLKAGEGLMIGQVAKGSPAAALGLQNYDILIKFNDQWLMSAAQFVTLVENAGPEAEVSLTYLRRGEECLNKVKLTAPPPVPVTPEPNRPPRPEEMMGRVIRQLRENPTVLETVYQMLNSKSVATENFMAGVKHGSRVTLKDDLGSVEQTTLGDAQEIRMWDPAGRLVFSGPCGTPAQREALPPDVLQRLQFLQEKCRSSTHSSAPISTPVKSAAPAAPAAPAQAKE